jgi:hypothetical protein
MNMLRNNEQGGARVKLVVFLLVFGLVIYVGYMYVPVAIDSYYFKDVMQNKADQAATVGYDSSWLHDQLVKLGPDYHVPPDASISAATEDQRVVLHVKFTRPISFPGYTYNYEFDHTVKSSTFLISR